ncbi:glycosyltransferase involved in cell wall biosynthesis [Kineococcus radiotolerans]|uniref:4,4'-diaponeurosporenoate glycosyltransferase n=1 Tax=Kineococcus radiotolerans TaxID=131568 RepID=A0A7W4TKX4_KINRA|nr:glycosyltransferase [Kineococcus radiotolerans]MBB2900523.1 glycosyltransferase involved in cell wall biosynthesis [Kineococcus radiotolerans]
MTLRRVVVVVPARDEAATIGRCVASVLAAAAECPVPVDLVVVADACRDDTAALAAAAGARVVTSRAGSAGAARARGVEAALAAVPAGEAATTWIACTDGDSTVAPGWLAHHLRCADAGVDLLLGTVRLAGPPERHRRWREDYERATWTGGTSSGHGHVHGANLGVRASVYLAAGGFPSAPAHEDRALAERVRALRGARVLSSTEQPVLTSDRLIGRAPEGVARDLSA